MDIKLTHEELSKISTTLGFACGVIQGLSLGHDHREDIASRAIEEINKIHNLILSKFDIKESSIGGVEISGFKSMGGWGYCTNPASSSESGSVGSSHITINTK